MAPRQGAPAGNGRRRRSEEIFIDAAVSLLLHTPHYYSRRQKYGLLDARSCRLYIAASSYMGRTMIDATSSLIDDDDMPLAQADSTRVHWFLSARAGISPLMNFYGACYMAPPC